MQFLYRRNILEIDLFSSSDSALVDMTTFGFSVSSNV